MGQNYSPSYGIDEEYNARLVKGGLICCQRLSKLKLEKAIRCIVSYPWRDSNEVVSNSGFYWLRDLHQKKLDKQAVFWERVEELRGSLR